MVKQTATYMHKEVQCEASHEYIHICATTNNKPLRIYRSSETNDCCQSYQCCSTFEEDLYELSLITVSQDQSAVINDVSYSPAFQPPCLLSVHT